MNCIELTKKNITEIATKRHFTVSNVEKVIRLSSILDDLASIDAFKGKLALKGGTAINLVLLPQLPRLSVDLDLDLAFNCAKEEMLLLRKQLDNDLTAYCLENGYSLDKRESFSLCSYELLYDTVSGSRDKIKLDINYLNRCHIFEPQESIIAHPFDNESNIKVFHLQAIETFGSKISAFFERTKPRDLYDLYSLSQSNLFSSKQEKRLLRKCAVFYSTTGNESDHSFLEKQIDDLTKMSFSKIRAQLLPMLRIKSGAYPKDRIEQSVSEYLKAIIQLDDDDKEFISRFQAGDYHPELLFGLEMEHLENHPVALSALGKMKR